MIRFILPVLLLLVASCQIPHNSDSCTDCPTTADCADCPSANSADSGATTVSAEGSCCDAQVDNATATRALMVQASALCEECSETAMCAGCQAGVAAAIAACPGCEEGEFCSPCLEKYQAAVTDGLEGGNSECDSCSATEVVSAAGSVTTKAAMHEGCVMAGTGTCEDGSCPMKAACDAGVSACASGADCDMKANAETTVSAESSCHEAEAAATAVTQVSMHDGCVMAGTGTCEDGSCPMKAACDAGVSACAGGDGCDMKANAETTVSAESSCHEAEAAEMDNATATKALLLEATADCENCTAAKMCSDCDGKVKAMWAACEGCTEGAFCTDCLTSLKKAMSGECDGGSCESSAAPSESTKAAGATKASQEVPAAKSCCDEPKS